MTYFFLSLLSIQESKYNLINLFKCYEIQLNKINRIQLINLNLFVRSSLIEAARLIPFVATKGLPLSIS